MDNELSSTSLIDNQVPQNTLTIIGALESLGEQVASKGGSITGEFIDLFGKKVISFTSESIEDIIEYAFPNIEDQNIQEITGELREKIKKIIEVIKIMASDEELNKDINEILQLVSVTATTMIRTLVADLKEPIEESVDDIQESSQKIIVKLVQGTVRTTWDVFLAALDPIPFVGEIGGLINLAGSAVKTGVQIVPPIIKNFGTFVDIMNKGVGSILDITDSNIDNFDKISKKGSDVKNKISEIQERVARKIQGAADGIQQLGKTPLPRLPRRYAKQGGGNKSKKYRIYKRKSRKL